MNHNSLTICVCVWGGGGGGRREREREFLFIQLQLFYFLGFVGKRRLPRHPSEITADTITKQTKANTWATINP